MLKINLRNSFLILILFIAKFFALSFSAVAQSISVRDEPYGNAEIIATIDSLENIEIEDEIPYYLHIRLNDGMTGFVRKDDLPQSDRFTDLARRKAGRTANETAIAAALEGESVASVAAATVATVSPSANVSSSVRVRSSATPEGEIIASLNIDDALPFEGVESDFYRIKLATGQEGFVSKDWTEISELSALETNAATLADPTSLRARAMRAREQPLEIHFLDVGQGDGNLIICPNGNTIMIDAGTTSGESPDFVRSYVSNEIEPHGHDIDYLIVTHPDADHYNMLDDVLDEISIGTSFYVGSRRDYGDERMYDWIRETPDRSRRLSASYFDKPEKPNSEIDCGEAKVWILAAATRGSQSRKNALSIVTMFQYGDFEAILTGDATFATEKKVLSRYDKDWLQAELLKVGHHGSLATSTDKHWADAIRPQIVVVSAGYTNSYGHPRKKVIDKLTPHTIEMAPHEFRWATRRQGSGRRYNFKSFRSEKEGIYNTAVNGHTVVVSDGSSFEVLIDQGED